MVTIFFERFFSAANQQSRSSCPQLLAVGGRVNSQGERHSDGNSCKTDSVVRQFYHTHECNSDAFIGPIKSSSFLVQICFAPVRCLAVRLELALSYAVRIPTQGTCTFFAYASPVSCKLNLMLYPTYVMIKVEPTARQTKVDA